MQRFYPGWKSVLWLTVILGSGLAACSGGAKPPRALSFDEASIDRLVVSYEYSGWGTVKEEFVIRRLSHGGLQLTGYVESGGEASKAVDARIQDADFQELLRAVDAPAWSRRQGISEVAKMVSKHQLLGFEPAIRLPASACSPEEILATARAEVVHQGVERIVDASYSDGMRWTDDYPFVVLQIVFRDSPPIVMSSNSQMALMLPWQVGVPARRPDASLKQNWSVPLSRALKALVPSQSKLFQRLGGIDRMNQRLQNDLEIRAERACSAAKARGG